MTASRAKDAVADPGPYRLLGPWLILTVLGDPVGQGNIRHLGAGRPAVHQNAQTLLPWRAQLQRAAEEAITGGLWHDRTWPIQGQPVAVDVTFTVRKPLAAPKRRTTWPITRPDADHLLRAVLDALTAAGACRDDSQVVEATVRKTYPGEHAQALHVPGARICVCTVAHPEETP
jgi:Holliday junction resolvase RusA-like endonuclease